MAGRKLGRKVRGRLCERRRRQVRAGVRVCSAGRRGMQVSSGR